MTVCNPWLGTGGWRWLLIALIGAVVPCWAQNPIPSATSDGGGKSELERILGGRSRLPSGASQVFFEGAVNPDEYVIGPGDQFRLVFWRPTYSDVPVTVSGEGDIIIPLVGVVHVSGSTLTAARQLVNDAVRENLRVGQVSLVLSEPRRFRIHVAGAVAYPGPYVVPATARVADAIELAGGLKRERAFSGGDTTSAIISSRRKIELRSATGEYSARVDLLKYERTGDLSRNPYLIDGGIVFVPLLDTAGPQISVRGAVLEESEFEFVEGDNLETVISISGGLAGSANSASVKLLSQSGTERSLDARVEGKVALAAGDVLLVTGVPDTIRAGSVSIAGEVVRPGGYAIREGETTLRDILRSCGGLLPTAAAQSVRIIRFRKVDPIDVERNRLLAAATRLNPFFTYFADAQLAAELSRWDYGTVVLDVGDAESLSSDAGNTLLYNDDRIEVPSSPFSVRVIGSVNEAGEVPWVEGKPLKYYLRQAGGRSSEGWASRTVVLKARNGSQLRYSKKLPIDPGDVVFVPEKPVHLTNWSSFKDFIAVTAQVATVVLVVQQLGK